MFIYIQKKITPDLKGKYLLKFQRFMLLCSYRSANKSVRLFRNSKVRNIRHRRYALIIYYTTTA